VVRLLSLLILLLAPSPFKSRAAVTAPRAQSPPAIAPASMEADRAPPARPRAAVRSGPTRDPVPAPPDSDSLIAEPQEHPIV
jgi:hypothetical protein